MDWRSPMKVYRNQEPVGSIVSYSSGRPRSTGVVGDDNPDKAECSEVKPWATGIVEVEDPDRAERLYRAVRYLRGMALEGVDRTGHELAGKEVFDAEMARNGLTPADIDWCTEGVWTMRTRDGKIHPMHSVHFVAEGTIRWQW